MTYSEMANSVKPEAAALLAGVLLRIYEADRTSNCGAVMGEAVLCGHFKDAAQHALTEAGVLK